MGSGLPHVGPWDYIQRVPMLWYGPGIIEARGEVDRPVTVADIAPTEAEILKFDGFEAAGRHAHGRIAPARRSASGAQGDRDDGLGRGREQRAGRSSELLALPEVAHPEGDVLHGHGGGLLTDLHRADPRHDRHRGLPHDTRHHRTQHERGGQHHGPWSKGPAFFIKPTLGDVYDRAMDNEPVVGLVGTVDIHFGMLGHGSFFGGGDRDIALTRSVLEGKTLTDEGFEWNLPEKDAPYYFLPEYANQVEGFEDDVEAVDQADGKDDGKWRDNDIKELLEGFDTPARTPYQQRVVEEVMTREGFGADDVPDLMYLNFKEIDFVSHVWSMNSPEMRDAVVAQDLALEELVTFLDREVGKGDWVLALTADHASMPDPAVSGGFQISTGPMQQAINAEVRLRR